MAAAATRRDRSESSGYGAWGLVLTLLLGAVFNLLGSRSVPAAETAAKQDPSLCILQAGSEAPYPPFQTLDSAGHFGGLEINLLRAIGREIGCEIAITAMPWGRILKSIEAGTLDIAMNAIRKPERESFAWFSGPYMQAEVHLFVRREDARKYSIRRLEDLLTIPGVIGTIIGYSFGQPIDDLIAANPAFAARLSAGRDYKSNLRMLMHGRLDAMLGQTETVIAAAREIGLGDSIVGLGYVFDVTPYHFMLSRKSVPPERVTAINAALDKLQQMGAISELIALYR